MYYEEFKYKYNIGSQISTMQYWLLSIQRKLQAQVYGTHQVKQIIFKWKKWGIGTGFLNVSSILTDGDSQEKFNTKDSGLSKSGKAGNQRGFQKLKRVQWARAGVWEAFLKWPDKYFSLCGPCCVYCNYLLCPCSAKAALHNSKWMSKAVRH